MTTRILSIALATTALAGTLAGGAQAADLRMSWWGGDSRHEATLAALEACSAKYDHEVSPEFTGWSGHFEKVTTQIAGGTEADIMQINWPWLPIYSATGEGFADLRGFGDTIDLSQWSEAELEAGSMNGVLQGLPISTTGRLFLFNTTTWEEAGLELPTTWDELVAAGPVFAETLGEDHFPFEATGLDASLIIQLWGTQKYGKTLVGADNNQIQWSAEELTAAIEFYDSLVENHVVQSWSDLDATGVKALHENPAWTSGKIASTYQWNSTYFKLSDPLEEGEEITYAGLLSQEGQETQGIYRKPSMTFAISRNSDNPEAAAEIVNCLLNEEEGVLALGTTRGLPASNAALSLLQSAGEIPDVLVDAQEKVIESTGPTIHPIMEHPDLRAAIEDNLELFAYGEMDAATTADEILYGIEEVLLDNFDS